MVRSLSDPVGVEVCCNIATRVECGMPGISLWAMARNNAVEESNVPVSPLRKEGEDSKSWKRGVNRE